MLLLYVICKTVFVEEIFNKINIIEHRKNTCCKIKKRYDVTIDKNPKSTKLLGFKITQKENKLPVLCQTPKMLKNPLGTHLIIATKISSTIC